MRRHAMKTVRCNESDGVSGPENQPPADEAGGQYHQHQKIDGLLPPLPAPTVLHGISAFTLCHFPGGNTDPEIFPARARGRGFVISPSAAALVPELHDGEISTRRCRRGNKQRQCGNSHTHFIS
jgi:hypothetical protein